MQFLQRRQQNRPQWQGSYDPSKSQTNSISHPHFSIGGSHSGTWENSRIQPKLEMGTPGDKYEQEADRVANQVVSNISQGQVNEGGAASTVQRACQDCEEEKVQQKPETGLARSISQNHSDISIINRSSRTGGNDSSGNGGLEQGLNASKGQGQSLPDATRQQMESQIGADFSGVKVHTGNQAVQMSQDIQARAFTHGKDIYFNQGQYDPGSTEGKRLLAHELTHVVQQNGAGDLIQRATIHGSCAGNQPVVTAAVDRADDLVVFTIRKLQIIRDIMIRNGNIGEKNKTMLRNFWGDINGLEENRPNVMALDIDYLIEDYQKIHRGIQSAATIMRCDPQTVGDGSECQSRNAFVDMNNPTNVYLCPAFLGSGDTVANSHSVIHEMAHSVLGMGHDGGRMLSFGCDEPQGLTFAEARQNAYMYETFCACLASDIGQAVSVTVSDDDPIPPGMEEEKDSAGSVSLQAGAIVSPEARFVTGVGTQLSLRRGEFVVFNPTIGVNVFYAPPGAEDQLVTAIGDVGLRIQQPMDGFYMDIGASGYGSAAIPQGEGAPEISGGAGVTLGGGWRSKNIELGVTARTLFPIGSDQSNTVWVAGRGAIRF